MINKSTPIGTPVKVLPLGEQGIIVRQYPRQGGCLVASLKGIFSWFYSEVRRLTRAERAVRRAKVRSRRLALIRGSSET